MTDPTHRPWYRRLGLIASLVIVAVAILSLAVVGVTSLIRDHRAEPGRSSPPPTGAVTSTSPGCPTDTGSAMAAPQVKWQSLGQMQLPYGGSVYGPCQVTATTAAGYSHTPGGALVAAAQIFARSTTSAPVDVAMATVQQQFVATGDRDILLDSARNSPRQSLSPQRVARVAAYQVSSYTLDAASLSVAYRSDAMPGQYVVMRLVMRWVDGDWRMVPPIAGTWSGAGQTLAQLPGFTAWGP